MIARLMRFALLAAALGCEKPKPCGEIKNWDECANASHCTPATLSVAEGTPGPIWACHEKRR